MGGGINHDSGCWWHYCYMGNRDGVRGERQKFQLWSPIRLRSPWVVLEDRPGSCWEDRYGLQTEIGGLPSDTVTVVCVCVWRGGGGLKFSFGHRWRSLRNIWVHMSSRLLDIQL